jgi:Ran-binding protein 3
VVSTNKEPEDEKPPEALIIDAESHATDQGKETGANVEVKKSNEQQADRVHMGTSSTGLCLVKDGDGREEASESLQLKTRDSHLDSDSVSEDKHTGSNEVDDGHVKDAKQCEVASANSISSISIPPPGVNFSSSTFSFGTAPLSFATPTGFASFRNSSQTFGSTENATSGTNPGAAFSFKFSDDNPFESDNAPGFQLSSSEKSESAAPLSGSFKLQEVSVHTGEENETAVFSSDASLFEFASNAWKQRGKGELKINVSRGSKNRARMLMRMKGNYKLLLNANLFPDMKVTSMENRGVTFACINSAAEERKGLTTYALKFRDGMLATSFQDIVNTYKRGSYLGLKTPENSP